MNVLARILGRAAAPTPAEMIEPTFERRELGPYDFDPRFLNWNTPTATPQVGADAVLSNISVAHRCVSLRSELLASVPLHVYRRTADGGRERADDHPLAPLLNGMANPNTTAFEHREFLVRSLDLAGNAYARIDRDGRGDVAALWQLPPRVVQVEELPTRRLRYRISEANRVPAVLLQEETLHIRAASSDGLIGRSPLTAARGTFGLAMSEVRTAQALMLNSLRPSLGLTHPGKLSGQALANIAQSVKERASGASAGGILVFEEGMKAEMLSFTPHDVQLLESRRVSNEDVARIFACPPTSVGIADRQTFATFEGEARALVQNALAPLARRIETALARCLLTESERAAFFVEHDLNGLLRGDLKTRMEAYRIAREMGVLSPNDVRRRENEPPIPNGDEYIRPLNMAPLGTPAPTPGRQTRGVSH